MKQVDWPNSDLSKAFAMTDEDIEVAVACDPDDVMLSDAELASVRLLTRQQWLEELFGPDAAAALMSKAAE
jgi:hypothetical protein